MVHEADATSAALVGSSPRIVELRRMIEKVGRKDVSVLILGETGTGKEIVARALHAARGLEPFVPIDCAGLGPLLESELFGHVRGAFTGAIANKPGLLEAAAGGTAFFDEIGELPSELQSKLLRVLQQKEVRPVGSVRTRPASFRVIAATNRDLAREVERGAFRRDLYFRLNVISIRLPPLRERKQDIPELARHFLGGFGRGHALSEPLAEMLMAYDWPGNVRELENCIRRMVAVNSGPFLHAADLPSAVAGWAAAQALPAAPGDAPRAPEGRVVPLEQLEHDAILAALEVTRGDHRRAAHLLGIGRTTLYRKLKRYGLIPPRH